MLKIFGLFYGLFNKGVKLILSLSYYVHSIQIIIKLSSSLIQSVPEEEGDRHAVGDAERRQPPPPVQRLLPRRRRQRRLRQLQRQRRLQRQSGGGRGRRRRGAAGEPGALAEIQVLYRDLESNKDY